MLGNHSDDDERGHDDPPGAHAYTFTVDGHTVSVKGGVGESELKKLARHVQKEFKDLQSGDCEPYTKRQGKGK